MRLGGAISERSQRFVGARLRQCRGARYLADDLRQEAVLAAWRAERAGRPTWLAIRGFTAALLRGEARNRRWCGAKALEAPRTTPDPIPGLVDLLSLAEAMAGLSDSQRDILHRVYWLGQSCEEIGRDLGHGGSCMAKRRRAAESRLRELLRA